MHVEQTFLALTRDFCHQHENLTLALQVVQGTNMRYGDRTMKLMIPDRQINNFKITSILSNLIKWEKHAFVALINDPSYSFPWYSILGFLMTNTAVTSWQRGRNIFKTFWNYCKVFPWFCCHCAVSGNSAIFRFLQIFSSHFRKYFSFLYGFHI